jgi:DNA-binding transcriptional regulator GbsR (MarR family)
MNEIETDFASFLRKLMREFGFKWVSPSVVAVVFLSKDDISIDNISKKTGLSLASVSSKAKNLETVGLFERIKKKGTKKVYYYMPKSVVSITRRFLEIKYSKGLIPAKIEIPKMIHKYETKKLSKEESDQLEILKNYNKQLGWVEKKLLFLMNLLNTLKVR